MAERRQAFDEDRDPASWHLLFEGVAAGNGWTGDAIEAANAEQIEAAFQEPYRYAQVHTAGFYDDAGFCEQCDVAYCYRHWRVSQTGYGHCPQGHGKSLDPHWRALRPLASRVSPDRPSAVPSSCIAVGIGDHVR
jgi:hypothetical protein